MSKDHDNWFKDKKTRDINKEPFVLVKESLAMKEAVLSYSAKHIFNLMFFMVVRKDNRELAERSNPFKLSYTDFVKFGVAKSTFKDALKELVKKNFIRIEGKYKNKTCKLLTW